jgi:hypothetical protein
MLMPTPTRFTATPGTAIVAATIGVGQTRDGGRTWDWTSRRRALGRPHGRGHDRVSDDEQFVGDGHGGFLATLIVTLGSGDAPELRG